MSERDRERESDQCVYVMVLKMCLFSIFIFIFLVLSFFDYGGRVIAESTDYILCSTPCNINNVRVWTFSRYMGEVGLIFFVWIFFFTFALLILLIVF